METGGTGERNEGNEEGEGKAVANRKAWRERCHLEKEKGKEFEVGVGGKIRKCRHR